MQAYEFDAAIENGIIRVPPMYRDRIRSHVKVILLEQEGEKTAPKEFTALRLHTKGYKFDREEANER
jgi:hypothetical protein